MRVYGAKPLNASGEKGGSDQRRQAERPSAMIVKALDLVRQAELKSGQAGLR